MESKCSQLSMRNMVIGTNVARRLHSLWPLGSCTSAFYLEENTPCELAMESKDMMHFIRQLFTQIRSSCRHACPCCAWYHSIKQMLLGAAQKANGSHKHESITILCHCKNSSSIRNNIMWNAMWQIRHWLSPQMLSLTNSIGRDSKCVSRIVSPPGKAEVCAPLDVSGLLSSSCQQESISNDLDMAPDTSRLRIYQQHKSG